MKACFQCLEFPHEGLKLQLSENKPPTTKPSMFPPSSSLNLWLKPHKVGRESTFGPFTFVIRNFSHSSLAQVYNY